MTENTQDLAQTFEIYCDRHPEKFEKRTQSLRKTLYMAGTAVCVLLIIFPAVIPLLPLWAIRVAAVIGLLICAASVWVGCEEYYNRQSNGLIRHIGRKKFDRVNAKTDEVVAAFLRRDFDFLADAAETESDPLQLYVYEDAAGHEFYLQLRAYASPSEFNPVAEVMTVSGKEYDDYKTTIKSIHPIK